MIIMIIYNKDNENADPKERYRPTKSIQRKEMRATKEDEGLERRMREGRRKKCKPCLTAAECWSVRVMASSIRVMMVKDLACVVIIEIMTSL